MDVRYKKTQYGRWHLILFAAGIVGMVVLSSLLSATAAKDDPGHRPLAETTKTVRTLDIAPVWSGHPIGFALRTTGKRQLVAFYDARIAV